MKITIFLSTLFLLVACGPSNKDKQNVATITCNIIAETKNMDPAMKIKVNYKDGKEEELIESYNRDGSPIGNF